MKKGIVIGASRDAIHTIKKAREKGIYVVALDGNPNAEGFKFANESIVVDISDLDKTSNEVARIKPDFTIPIPIGRYLSTMGYINDKFQLCAQLRVCNQVGGNPIYPRSSQPDNSESWDVVGNSN